jgi:hypothetical protein
MFSGLGGQKSLTVLEVLWVFLPWLEQFHKFLEKTGYFFRICGCRTRVDFGNCQGMIDTGGFSEP